MISIQFLHLLLILLSRGMYPCIFIC